MGRAHSKMSNERRTILMLGLEASGKTSENKNYNVITGKCNIYFNVYKHSNIISAEIRTKN